MVFEAGDQQATVIDAAAFNLPRVLGSKIQLEQFQQKCTRFCARKCLSYDFACPMGQKVPLRQGDVGLKMRWHECQRPTPSLVNCTSAWDPMSFTVVRLT
jgi:hypothetical protein